MPIYRFAEVTRRRKVGGTCTKCGARRARTFSVTHTVSPYNQNADGTVRTREQVVACVSEELRELTSGPFICASCAKEPK